MLCAVFLVVTEFGKGKNRKKLGKCVGLLGEMAPFLAGCICGIFVTLTQLTVYILGK